MNRDTVPRDHLNLKDDHELLSPPILVEPLYRCATSVTVTAFIAHAEIDIEIDGSIVRTVVAGFPLPNGESITLPNPLAVGQVVRARQRTATKQSPWSTPPITVRDHTQDFPAGPPRPEINPAPVYKCGSRTGVSNLLVGGNVWITADGSEVGRVNGCRHHQGVDVNPDYDINQRVRAWFELCGDPSPPSTEYITISPPSPLPTPGFDPVYEGGEQITITTIVNGARVTLYRNGIEQGTWRCWGWKLCVDLYPRFSAGETFSATQSMCLDVPSSPSGSTVSKPCSDVPAPRLGPIQVGDDRVTLIEFIPDAIIKVYINRIQAGEGSGPTVILNRIIQHNDVIHVVQDLGGCRGQTAGEGHPKCVNPHILPNPSDLNLFPIGHIDYVNGDVKGSVYYPANDDGEGQPFSERLAEVNTVPIVFMAHGNHSIYYNPADRNQESCTLNPGWLPIPNHNGYDYFQQKLAKMGIIAVSVDCNATNCTWGGASNIEARADLIIASIAYFQSLDSDSSSIFYQKIDFHSIGLMGHSRGGDAVVLVPEVISLPNTNIKAVISLAPTDFGASSGKPRNYAFITILPAGDGDVVENDGAKFYDQAIPEPIKSQFYTHRTNHNFFNRQWPSDEGDGPTRISRAEHEQILSSYGCAFYRRILLDHLDMTKYLFGHSIPSGISFENVHISFEFKGSVTVDNFEDGNGIGLNSLGSSNIQSGGLNADEYAFRQGPGSFNGSFYGNSTGMVITCRQMGSTFRFQFPELMNIENKEIWIRCAEVYIEPRPPDPTSFDLGIEDQGGATAWANSDNVGSLLRPYYRGAYTKTMLKTLRFPANCFITEHVFDRTHIRAIIIRCAGTDQRPIAFDDLQIVEVR